MEVSTDVTEVMEYWERGKSRSQRCQRAMRKGGKVRFRLRVTKEARSMKRASFDGVTSFAPSPRSL